MRGSGEASAVVHSWVPLKKNLKGEVEKPDAGWLLWLSDNASRVSAAALRRPPLMVGRSSTQGRSPGRDAAVLFGRGTRRMISAGTSGREVRPRERSDSPSRKASLSR